VQPQRRLAVVDVFGVDEEFPASVLGSTIAGQKT
jgi:hypothetical protein